VEGYIAILLPENRVPGYPFYYLTGTQVQKYPKVRALVGFKVDVDIFSVSCLFS